MLVRGEIVAVINAIERIGSGWEGEFGGIIERIGLGCEREFGGGIEKIEGEFGGSASGRLTIIETIEWERRFGGSRWTKAALSTLILFFEKRMFELKFRKVHGEKTGEITSNQPCIYRNSGQEGRLEALQVSLRAHWHGSRCQKNIAEKFCNTLTETFEKG